MRQRSEVIHSALVLVPENRFAHAAAIRLLDPSNTAVPIVTVFGPSGVGKSQLARHIYRQSVVENPNVRVAHVTASEVAVELAKASQAGVLDEFQTTYRRLQLLICEDIQVLERRQETQQQLLMTIDEIIRDGGRVLLTSARAPGELKGLCPKFVNRCHGGVCGEIDLPGPGTRAILLQEFAQSRGLVLKDQWVQKLARRIDGTPRELMGAVIHLETLAVSQQSTIDERCVADYVNRLQTSTGPTIAHITKQVASVFGVSAKDIREGGRGQSVVTPRQVAMFLAREGTNHRYTEIGRYFSGRRHSTVVHACQQIRQRMLEDSLLRQQVQQIAQGLRLSLDVSCQQPLEETSPES
jgi:chromosomal replication initiator protein